MTFRHIHMEVCRTGVMGTFCSASRVTGCDVQQTVNNPLHMKMVRYIWRKAEIDLYFKEKCKSKQMC